MHSIANIKIATRTQRVPLLYKIAISLIGTVVLSPVLVVVAVLVLPTALPAIAFAMLLVTVFRTHAAQLPTPPIRPVPRLRPAAAT